MKMSQGAGLYDWLADVATREPDRELLVDVAVDREVSIDAATLKAMVACAAAGFSRLGLTTGDCVALWLPNCVEWFVTEFACAALGVTVLGLNTRYRAHEVSHLFRTVPIAALILPDAFLGIDFPATLATAFDEIRESDPVFVTPRLIVVGEVAESHQSIDPAAVAWNELADERVVPVGGEHLGVLANLFTTSGSTSAPKVAGHDQASIIHHAYAGARALGAQPGDRILAALPMCGVFGFNSVMALLFGGGAAVLMASFEAREAGRLLTNARISHVVGGDEMLGAMFAAVGEGVDLPDLRRGGIANFAGRAKEVVEEAHHRWGAAISGVYGSSELFALTAIWPEKAPLSLRIAQGGVLVDGAIDVRVVDLDSGEPVTDGDPGELQFRGYNVIDGYVNNDIATRSAFTTDGWFRSGDLGYVANGGFIYQCRAREVMRLRGFLVEPGEIEDFFTGEAGVEEIHVVGVETDVGMRAVAFIKPRAGEWVDEAALLARAKVRLAGYKIPERIIEVSEFPTTTGTNGTKVRFEVLRERARELLDHCMSESVRCPDRPHDE